MCESRKAKNNECVKKREERRKGEQMYRLELSNTGQQVLSDLNSPKDVCTHSLSPREELGFKSSLEKSKSFKTPAQKKNVHS